jgi:hypothetical protein
MEMKMSKSAAFVKNIVGNPRKKKIETSGPYLKKNEDFRFAVARIILCGLLNNQFYKSKDALSKEALNVFSKAAVKDPEFLLKAAAFSRRGDMKGMVLLAIATLQGKADDDFLTDNRNAFVSVLSTFAPMQLLQFVEICKSKQLGRGFGSRPQRWVQRVMESWAPEKVEDYTLKYPAALKTLVRLVHPSWTDVRGRLVRYVLDSSTNYPKYGHSHPTGSKQKAVEKLKSKKSQPATVARAMLEYEIPWDVVKGFYSGYNTGDVGLATLTQMGLTALLLNIRSLEQGGVFDNSNGIKALKLKLAEVKNGRSIPLDFAKPYLYSSNLKVKNVLVDAITDSLDNSLPEIEGSSVAVSVDVSGSMSGEPLVTAGLLSVPFLKAQKLWFTTFSDGVHEQGTKGTGYWGRGKVACPKITGQSRKEQVKGLLNLTTVGGTNSSAPIKKAISNKRKVDLFVLVTDEQQNQGTPVMSAWKEYKKKVNSKAELWIINASSYEWHSVDFNDPSVTVYQTMTPAIFRNLEYLGQDLVSAIENFDLSGVRQVNRRDFS